MLKKGIEVQSYRNKPPTIDPCLNLRNNYILLVYVDDRIIIFEEEYLSDCRPDEITFE